MVWVSAPVYRKDSPLADSISIFGFYRPNDDGEAAGQIIRQKAAELSLLLGYQ